ncbi:MAG: hypothetical protein FWC89_04530 [Defluviitaleaceae bacterium]|nr:hypothetical protein [Defluviitaleaceae bacterium]
MLRKIFYAICVPVLLLIPVTFLSAAYVGENCVIEATGVSAKHPIIGTWSFVDEDDPTRILYSEDGIPFSGTLSLFADGFATNTHLTMLGQRTGNWRIDGDQLYIYRSEELRRTTGSSGLGAGLAGMWTFSISEDGKTLTLENDETTRTFTWAGKIHDGTWRRRRF